METNGQAKTPEPGQARISTGTRAAPVHPKRDVEGEAASDDFRRVMRRVIGGVTVVTTRHEGRAWGMTVNAFSAVSVDPPTILVCINSRTVTAEDSLRDGRFAVNLLSEGQVELSQLCARPAEAKYLDDHLVPPEDLPARVAMPVLRGSLATFDCRLSEARAVASHFVMIGTVEAIVAPSPRPPLLYGEGQYLRRAWIDQALPAPEAGR